MTKQSLKNRLGTPYFNDKLTQLHCHLPGELLIYSYTGRIWLGGSQRPTDLLYIERVPADTQGVPTVLADGDIDLNLVSIGTAEELGAGAEGLVVAGYFRDQSFSGYLALVPIDASCRYLVMIASTQLEEESSQKQLCMAVMEEFQGARARLSAHG